MEKKSVLLGVPSHFGLSEKFIENFKFIGFDVYFLEQGEENLKISMKDEVIHVIKKFLFKDRTHKKRLKTQLKDNQQIDFLSNLKTKIDYALIIRPDLYSKKVIGKINEIANLSVAYQWDGLSRFPVVYDLIEDFDRFFVFDVRDSNANKNLIPITNFYFDDLKSDVKKEFDVFFVGSYMKNRIEEVVKLSNYFDKLNLKTNIIINVDKKRKVKKYLNSSINFTNKSVDFKDSLELIDKADIILDFKNDIHYGLSIRTFEAIGYKKKLITNNELVKQFDFFNSANIFLLGERNIEELEEFILTPYQDLEQHIYEKYSFTNWVKNIFNISPFIKIELK